MTLPESFYLELDFEAGSLVERARSDPLSLLAGGGGQMELGRVIQASVCMSSTANIYIYIA